MKIKKDNLYTIREIHRNKLLISARCNSPQAISEAIKEGKLKALSIFKKVDGKGSNYYYIKGSDLIKFRDKKIAENNRPFKLKKEDKHCLKERTAKKQILCLKGKYKITEISKATGVSKQYVHQVLNK